MRALLLAVLLSGCAPSTYEFGGWQNSRGECDQLDSGGGQWATELCRDGKGVLVWSVWAM